MNANILSLIFEYSNKFNLPIPTKNERKIVASFAKTSYIQHVKAKKYNQQVMRFGNVINDLRIAFGHENVIIKHYHADPYTFEHPGHATIVISGITFEGHSISLRTDMHYICPANYTLDIIETCGGIRNLLELEYIPEQEFSNSKELIKAIQNSHDYYLYLCKENYITPENYLS